MISDMSSQYQFELFLFGAQFALGIVGKPPGIFLAAEYGIEDEPAGDSHYVGRYRTQLDARVFQQSVNAIGNSGPVLHQSRAVSSQIPKLLYRLRRDEAAR